MKTPWVFFCSIILASGPAAADPVCKTLDLQPDQPHATVQAVDCAGIVNTLKSSGRFPGAVFLADLDPAFDHTCYMSEPVPTLLNGKAVTFQSRSAWLDNSDIYGPFGSTNVVYEAAEFTFFDKKGKPIGKLYNFNNVNLDLTTFGDFRESEVVVDGTLGFRNATGQIKVRTSPLSATSLELTSFKGTVCKGK